MSGTSGLSKKELDRKLRVVGTLAHRRVKQFIADVEGVVVGLKNGPLAMADVQALAALLRVLADRLDPPKESLT